VTARVCVANEESYWAARERPTFTARRDVERRDVFEVRREGLRDTAAFDSGLLDRGQANPEENRRPSSTTCVLQECRRMRRYRVDTRCGSSKLEDSAHGLHEHGIIAERAEMMSSGTKNCRFLFGIQGRWRVSAGELGQRPEEAAPGGAAAVYWLSQAERHQAAASTGQYRRRVRYRVRYRGARRI
jgi:hypothetical protein